jgi:hypothetical protein
MKIGLIWLGVLYVVIPAMVVAQSAKKQTLVEVWAVKVAPREHLVLSSWA